MRGSHSNSPPPASPSPGLVGVRGGRAYFALPNLIQQRSSAFAMGVGKLQQPAAKFAGKVEAWGLRRIERLGK